MVSDLIYAPISLVRRALLRRRSPYHRIAYEFDGPTTTATLNRLLDYGLLSRAKQRLALSQVEHPLVIARIAFLEGAQDSAVEMSSVAMALYPKGTKEHERAWKLLIRLSPTRALKLAQKSNNRRMITRISVACGLDADVNFEPLLLREGDELLLSANLANSVTDKVSLLNKYFSEMNLRPVTVAIGSSRFDINTLGTDATTHLRQAPAGTVSVIMTVKDAESYVRSSILSALNQVGVVVQLVIIDDGSTDRSWEIISELHRDNPDRVFPTRLRSNIGTYAAKNLALQKCTAEFVAFQDADDWSHSERLYRAVTWLNRSKKNVAVTCRYVRLNEASRFYSPAGWPLRQWSPNTLVFRRTPVLELVGKFDQVRFGADTDYFERIRARFGDRRINFQRETMLIAMGLSSSLMHNGVTGTDRFGYSEARTRYRETSAERILRGISMPNILSRKKSHYT